MPAKSQAQQHFMGMCKTSKGRKKAKGKCPSKEVATEFARKPPGKKLPKRQGKKGK